MKRLPAMLLMVLLALALLCVCGGEDTTLDAEDGTPAAPVTITLDELAAILDTLDISEATLTAYRDGTGNTYGAAAAIRAETYLDELRGYAVKEYIPQSDWNSEEDLSFRLETPAVTLSMYQLGGYYPLRITTGTGKGWFIMPSIVTDDGGAEQYGWMLPKTLSHWYGEACAAALCAVGGTPLAAEELSWFEDYLASERVEYDETWGGYTTYGLPVSCFFTSLYYDVRDLDAEAFIQYFPAESLVSTADGEEARLVAEKADWRGEDGTLWSVDELPVPCHRIPRETLDEALTKYAGVTVAEMHTDWMEELFYLPETDCFYTFTSDWGPGVFSPVYGERGGDRAEMVTLRGAMDTERGTVMTLRLEKAGENWLIRSHMNEPLPLAQK